MHQRVIPNEMCTNTILLYAPRSNAMFVGLALISLALAVIFAIPLRGPVVRLDDAVGY